MVTKNRAWLPECDRDSTWLLEECPKEAAEPSTLQVDSAVSVAGGYKIAPRLACTVACKFFTVVRKQTGKSFDVRRVPYVVGLSFFPFPPPSMKENGLIGTFSFQAAFIRDRASWSLQHKNITDHRVNTEVERPNVENSA